MSGVFIRNGERYEIHIFTQIAKRFRKASKSHSALNSSRFLCLISSRERR